MVHRNVRFQVKTGSSQPHDQLIVAKLCWFLGGRSIAATDHPHPSCRMLHHVCPLRQWRALEASAVTHVRISFGFSTEIKIL